MSRLKRLRKGLTVTQLDSMCAFKHVLFSSWFFSAQTWVNLLTGKLTCPQKINGWNLEHLFPIEIHFGMLTWNLKSTCLKRKIIFQTFIFWIHVHFQGCSPFSSGHVRFGWCIPFPSLGFQVTSTMQSPLPWVCEPTMLLRGVSGLKRTKKNMKLLLVVATQTFFIFTLTWGNDPN